MLDVVILCGGTGSRLWPLSRSKHPKQFLNIIDKDLSMFQTTVLRINKLNPHSINILVNLEYNFLVKQQLDQINISNYKIISEPVSCNTAPAICIASHLLDINSNVLIVTSDHIWDDNKFNKAVKAGLHILDSKKIILFGIKPHYPETGYGYVRHSNNNILEFVEKPSYDKALSYLNNNYLWNSGVFLFNNCFIRNKFMELQPNMYYITEQSINHASYDDTNKYIILDREYYSKLDNISFDYAIVEKITGGGVIIYDGIWSDLGSFDAIYNNLEKNNNDCVIDGDHVRSIDTFNCYIKSHNKLITTIGIQDLVVVDTDDAILICNKNRCQDVKNLVKILDNNIIEKSQTEIRPWGSFTNILGNDTSGYKVKKIIVNVGCKLSLQSHSKRSEHWVITQGRARVQICDDFHILESNQHAYIPTGAKHRLENIGDIEVIFTETQIGDYLGEDDIIRYEDCYGRT